MSEVKQTELSKEERYILTAALTVYRKIWERARDKIRAEVKEGKTPQVSPTAALTYAKQIDELKKRFEENPKRENEKAAPKSDQPTEGGGKRNGV